MAEPNEYIVVETVTTRYGITADNDADALKAVETGAALPLPGSTSVNRVAALRSQPRQDNLSLPPAAVVTGTKVTPALSFAPQPTKNVEAQ